MKASDHLLTSCRFRARNFTCVCVVIVYILAREWEESGEGVHAFIFCGGFRGIDEFTALTGLEEAFK